MSKKIILSLVCAISILMTGCVTASRTLIPYQKDEAYTPSPTVQALMRKAADQAIEKALSPTRWKSAVKGKKVSVEVRGLLDSDYHDFPSYIQAAIEAECAKAGAIVLPANPSFAGSGVNASDQAPDYRVIVNVGLGGIDMKRKPEIDGLALLGQIGTIGGSVLTGLALSGSIEAYAAIPAGVMLTGGLLWMILAPPIKTTYTLTSIVSFDVHVLPQNAAGSYDIMSGEGSQELVIPSSADGPYVLVTNTPF